jgi:hypothetical protein
MSARHKTGVHSNGSRFLHCDPGRLQCGHEIQRFLPATDRTRKSRTECRPTIRVVPSIHFTDTEVQSSAFKLLLSVFWAITSPEKVTVKTAIARTIPLIWNRRWTSFQRGSIRHPGGLELNRLEGELCDPAGPDLLREVGTLKNDRRTLFFKLSYDFRF